MSSFVCSFLAVFFSSSSCCREIIQVECASATQPVKLRLLLLVGVEQQAGVKQSRQTGFHVKTSEEEEEGSL